MDGYVQAPTPTAPWMNDSEPNNGELGLIDIGLPGNNSWLDTLDWANSNPGFPLGDHNLQHHAKTDIDNQWGRPSLNQGVSEVGDAAGSGYTPMSTHAQSSHNQQFPSPSNSFQDKAGSSSESPQKRLACPFFKHDPAEFRDQRTCIGPGFQSIHRLKEHLYRRHAPSRHRCDRCFSAHKNASELLNHRRSEKSCELKSETRDYGQMTTSQQTRLRSKRKEISSLSDEDKWKEIYRILFPAEDVYNIPSPYYYLDEESLQCNSGSPGSPDNKLISLRTYGEFINGNPPRELAQSFIEEIRNDIHQLDNECDQAEALFEMFWRLQTLTLKHYEQFNTM